jgi:DNA-binding transcriptional MerR regulator
MSTYTTGEMAKMCNVSVRTVQFYDTKGVLHPSDLTEGGRRLYNDDDLTKLRLICTLKTIGLTLDSIKSVMESELSEKILTLLLDEQVKLLSSEIDKRQKQHEMIAVIKANIHNTVTVPANTILDVEHIMKKKNKSRNTRKLALIYVGVGIASALGLSFMAWLVISGIWWGLAVYMSVAVFSIGVSVLSLRTCLHKIKTAIFLGIGAYLVIL